MLEVGPSGYSLLVICPTVDTGYDEGGLLSGPADEEGYEGDGEKQVSGANAFIVGGTSETITESIYGVGRAFDSRIVSRLKPAG